MARLDDRETLLRQDTSYWRRIMVFLSICVLAAILFVVILAVYTNVDEGVCGVTTDIPTSFLMQPRSLSLRSNIDVFALGPNNTKADKVGEFYSKLVSRRAKFRFVDSKNNIASTMTKELSDRFTIETCDSDKDDKNNPRFTLVRNDYLMGDCADETHSWNTMFSVSRENDYGSTLLMSTVSQDSKLKTFTLTTSSAGTVGTISFSDDRWEIHSSASETIPSYLFGFLAVMIDNSPTTFDCTIPTVSPSVSPSNVPSPSPSPSPSGALSFSMLFPLFSCVSVLVAMLLSNF